MPALSERHRLLGAQLQQGVGRRAQLQAHTDRLTSEEAQQRRETELLDQVVALLGAMQDTWTKQFQEAVGDIVSRGIAGVFGEELELRVEMGRSGDLPTAKFTVRDASGLETDVMDARGGGLVSVTAFLLRVLLLISARPPLARLLILDETFANVSAEYLPGLVGLLRRICEDGGFQVILVTHRPELAECADVAYRFRLEDGVTKVEMLRDEGDAVAQAGPPTPA